MNSKKEKSLNQGISLSVGKDHFMKNQRHQKASKIIQCFTVLEFIKNCLATV